MTFTETAKAELAKPLDKKNVKPPAPGKYGEYVEGWHVIAEANRIFGFDGWTRETVSMLETNRELLTLKDKGGADYQQWRVGFVAKVRVTAGGITREGTGFGSGMGKPEALGDAIESAVKEAETDAMKRALMTFGMPFGLALYDKSKSNVADASVDEMLFKHRFALRDAPSKQALKEAWDEIPWDKVNVQWKLDLTAEKDARLATLNATVGTSPQASLDKLQETVN